MIENILGRKKRSVSANTAAMIAGRTVMVTGAGGSIGSELCRQIHALHPLQLVMVDSCEHHIYRIDQEIGRPKKAIIGDIRDDRHMSAIFRRYTPDIVFHAAANKHVPLSESNIEEAILTNVFGTANIVRACRENDTPMMVLVSTDKAVNPSSVMGATKRLAEMLCHPDGSITRFVTVRFGNVLGSAGSVVPLFEAQIAKGGPVTITHPDMTRYFMTIGEAVDLTIRAASLYNENNLYVLNMGIPVRILDLAHQMIRLAGYRPHDEIEIVYTGLRPGEKLAEDLFYAGEELSETPEPDIMLATRDTIKVKESLLGMLFEACKERNSARALEILSLAVPEFR